MKFSIIDISIITHFKVSRQVFLPIFPFISLRLKQKMLLLALLMVLRLKLNFVCITERNPLVCAKQIAYVMTKNIKNTSTICGVHLLHVGLDYPHVDSALRKHLFFTSCEEALRSWHDLWHGDSDPAGISK